MRGLDLLGDLGDGIWGFERRFIWKRNRRHQGVAGMSKDLSRSGEPGYLETEGHIRPYTVNYSIFVYFCKSFELTNKLFAFIHISCAHVQYVL